MLKELFLNLVEYTTPFGDEKKLIPLLPFANRLIKDSVGNWYLKQGLSDTLFCAHLDNYCTKSKKVNIIQQGNIIKTDGTTILGSDNKAGVVVLTSMILDNVPGTYYFFCGEEPMAGGCHGSTEIFNKSPNFFKKFKRCVSFDRRNYGSLITRQFGRFTCSDDFLNALISEFAKNNMAYKKDITGWYTDSATFIDVIPEVVNISSGTFNEHTFDEYLDFNYVEQLCKAVSNIDWENLPVIRNAKSVSTPYENDIKHLYSYNDKVCQHTFEKINKILANDMYICLNSSEFRTGREMIFSKWHEDKEISVFVYPDYFMVDKKKYKSIKDLEKIY